ncbi:MAG: hypothetical protein ACI91G_000750 [Gammaproteobacteria bacterium]|jgi:hypothetical protein
MEVLIVVPHRQECDHIRVIYRRAMKQVTHIHDGLTFNVGEIGQYKFLVFSQSSPSSGLPVDIID